ncbi:hypothetical protein G4B88_008908 [Cannabis sativa]|uniref:Carbohydrate binding domain-containing protein n=1 Tax=Cannabis sativa TaxID=3483 RepID=A0A7J6HP82_CANSA|nr:hypothetical protein G4B88_008908 [Cannabis sativa]
MAWERLTMLACQILLFLAFQATYSQSETTETNQNNRHNVMIKNISKKKITSLKLEIQNLTGSLRGLSQSKEKNIYNFPQWIKVLKPGEQYNFSNKIISLALLHSQRKGLFGYFATRPRENSSLPIPWCWTALATYSQSETTETNQNNRHNVMIKNISKKKITSLKLEIQNLTGSLRGLSQSKEKNIYNFPQWIKVLKPGEQYNFSNKIISLALLHSQRKELFGYFATRPRENSSLPIPWCWTALATYSQSETTETNQNNRHNVMIKNISKKKITSLKLEIQNLTGSLRGLSQSKEKNIYNFPQWIKVLKPGEQYNFSNKIISLALLHSQRKELFGYFATRPRENSSLPIPWCWTALGEKKYPKEAN